MIRRIILWVSVALLVLFLMPFLPAVFGEMVARLPLGWIRFLRRTLPEVTPNWQGVGMVVVCSAILVVALHWICRWCYDSVVAGKSTAAVPAHWPRKWTAILFAAFWLLFAIVMGASGLGRELVWVSRFDEPLYIKRRSGYAEIKQAEGALTTALFENPTNVAQACALFMKGEFDGFNAGPTPTLWEEHHVLVFTNALGKCVGYILVPRNPRMRDRVGFVAVTGVGNPVEPQLMTNLPAMIAHLERLAH